MEASRRRTAPAWLFVAALLVMCAVLGALQYRWIGAVSVAEKERLRARLQANLNRLSLESSATVTNVCLALLPGEDNNYVQRLREWRASSLREGLVRSLAVATPRAGGLSLLRLDESGQKFVAAGWPDDWLPLRDRLLSRVAGQGSTGWRPHPPPGGDPGFLIDLPRFRPGPPGSAGPGVEIEWLIVELDRDYIRTVWLPELVVQHLGGEDYQVEVRTRGEPPVTVFATTDSPMGGTFDASSGLLEVYYERLFGRSGSSGPREGRRGRPADPQRGRFEIVARHTAGSLDAVVMQARRRNLAVTAGVLLLILASAAALVRFTRRSQRLAEMQMDFVAAVSHELRTPLAVIRTAAFNLRGRIAANPEQVERYGSLIQQESQRLTDLVEQVLQFASAKAGRARQRSEPLSVERVIEQSIESVRTVIEHARCTVETTVEPGLPPVVGDPLALQHALQNLLSNAARHGSEGHGWIGVSASRATQKGRPAVEIRVADRGPGIPREEQSEIFEPFFRGKRALQDQIHGTGLGLSLVKDIVQAHAGTIAVESEPARGAAFVIRLPAAPESDELTNSAG